MIKTIALLLLATQARANTAIRSQDFDLVPITVRSTWTFNGQNAAGFGVKIAGGLDVGSITVRGSETVVSTLTVGGNAFSVGGSSLTVANGFVGIGISSATDLLTIQSDGALVLRLKRFSSNASGVNLIMEKFRGTSLAPSVVTNADSIGQWRNFGFSGPTNGLVESATIKAEVRGTVTGNRVPGAMTFWTATNIANSPLTQRMVINSNGQVGIGTDVPDSMLDVNGSVTIRSSLIVVGTETVNGQDASGYSVKVASGINASVGCILLQGGQVCGPTSSSSPDFTAQINALAVSTTALSASTVAVAAIQGVIGQSTATLSVSTASLQTQVNALNVATGTFVLKAGDTMTGQLTISGATLTVTGQNASGYSLSVSSGISAQCINLQNGQVCGPGSGSPDFTAQINALAISTTALSASTSAISALQGTIGQSTATLSASTATLAARTTALETSTGTLLALINTKQNSFTGVSSSCAAGFYFDKQVTVNGVVTGGSCVAAGGGGSVTFSSGSVQDFAQVSFSGSFTDPCLAGTTFTITTNGGAVILGFHGVMEASNVAASVGLTYRRDGVNYNGTNAVSAVTNVGAFFNFIFNFSALDNPAAGFHNYCLVGQTGAGTGYIMSTDSGFSNKFWGHEQLH